MSTKTLPRPPAKAKVKATINQATSLAREDPPLSERERARYCEILEYVVIKFFSKASVEHLQAEARVAGRNPLRMWRQGGDVLDKIIATLQGTLASKEPPVSLDDLTITWEGRSPNKPQTLTGAQLERILDVLRWTIEDMSNPDDGDFWPLQEAGSLATHLRGIGQLLEELGQCPCSEPDARGIFLRSAQMLLATCVQMAETHEGPPTPPVYQVNVVGHAAEKGGPR